MILRKDVSYYETGDKLLVNFICCYLVIQAIHNLIVTVGINGMWWTVLSRGIVAAFLAFALIPIVIRQGIKAVAIELVVAILLAASYLFASTNSEFPSIAFNLIFAYVPMGIACLSIHDDSLLLKRLYVVAWLVEIVTFANAVNRLTLSYSMSLGYLLLLPALIHFDRFLENRKWLDLLMVGIDAMMIIFFASRGPIICVTFYFLLKVLFSSNMSPRKKAGLIVIALTLVSIVYFSIDRITIFLAELFSRYGGISRTLKLLSSGTIGYDANRNSIFDHYWDLINEAPIVGHGLAGSWDVSSYPHNIVIELFLAFGIPIGVVLISLLLFVTIKGISQRNLERMRLSQIFVAQLISLLWSGSFIMTPTFFVAIAICVKGVQAKVKV